MEMDKEAVFLKAIEYSQSKGLRILDQLKLPFAKEYIPIRNTKDAWICIKDMNVRGAPAIALVGCLALAIEIQDTSIKKEDIQVFVKEKMDYLVSARPTAVNISNAREELLQLMAESKKEDLAGRVVTWCEELLEKDIRSNMSIGSLGSKDIMESLKGEAANVLTTCNTGSLATAGYGTALGVIRALHEAGKLRQAFYTETRPYNQGIRLTGFELAEEKIPSTLICDNMAGQLMKSQKISAVVVGADRVAANGDTANKIGTLQLAVIAKHFGVPFYVAAPFTSIDATTPHGDDIKVEERSPEEIICCPCSHKEPLTSRNTKVWNPAFDVTPSDLITGGIITESKIYKYPFHFM